MMLLQELEPPIPFWLCCSGFWPSPSAAAGSEFSSPPSLRWVSFAALFFYPCFFGSDLLLLSAVRPLVRLEGEEVWVGASLPWHAAAGSTLFGASWVRIIDVFIVWLSKWFAQMVAATVSKAGGPLLVMCGAKASDWVMAVSTFIVLREAFSFYFIYSDLLLFYFWFFSCTLFIYFSLDLRTLVSYLVNNHLNML